MNIINATHFSTIVCSKHFLHVRNSWVDLTQHNGGCFSGTWKAHMRGLWSLHLKYAVGSEHQVPRAVGFYATVIGDDPGWVERGLVWYQKIHKRIDEQNFSPSILKFECANFAGSFQYNSVCDDSKTERKLVNSAIDRFLIRSIAHTARYIEQDTALRSSREVRTFIFQNLIVDVCLSIHSWLLLKDHIWISTDPFLEIVYLFQSSRAQRLKESKHNAKRSRYGPTFWGDYFCIMWTITALRGKCWLFLTEKWSERKWIRCIFVRPPFLEKRKQSMSFVFNMYRSISAP